MLRLNGGAARGRPLSAAPGAAARAARRLRRIDRVWLATALLLAALAVTMPAQALESARFTALSLLRMAPLLLLAAVLSGWLLASGAAGAASAALARRSARGIALAALLGTLSPCAGWRCCRWWPRCSRAACRSRP